LQESIGLLSTSYADVAVDVRDLFYSDVDTPRSDQDCYDNALASELLNLGTMLGSEDKNIVLLYEAGTDQVILNKALRAIGQSSFAILWTDRPLFTDESLFTD
jgi:hypothetical protein